MVAISLNHSNKISLISHHQIFCSIVLSACVLITACSNQDDAHFRVGLNASAITLDPRYATDAISYRITRLIYRSLVDFDAHAHPIPDLATWQKITDKHYRFTLQNSGRKFHNGASLTAEDVYATYASILADKLSPHRGGLEMISEIRVIDEDNIDFYLQKQDPLFPGRLSIGIMQKDILAKQQQLAKENIIGSGGMRFLDWPDDTKLRLIREKDGQIIELLTIKEPIVRVLKLINDEIDLIFGSLSPDICRWLKTHSDIELIQSGGNVFNYIGFNMDDAALKKPLVRQAIAYGLDRKSIIERVLGDAYVAANSLFPPSHWAGYDGSTSYAYNPHKAKHLLKQAGYDRTEPLQLSYKTSDNPFRVRLATIIQDQLRRIGIVLTIQSHDWGIFYADIKSGQFQMYSLSWVGLKIPDIFRYAFHSESVPPIGANRGRFKDVNIDGLIEAAEQEQDITKQAEYYTELQERLLHHLPYIPLWYEANTVAMRRNVMNYTVDSWGNFDGLDRVTK